MRIIPQPVEVPSLEAAEPPVSTFPRIDIVPLPGPMTEARAFVSPDCSYANLKLLLDEAQESLLIYIYNFTADYLLDLVRSAVGRGVDVKIMYDATDTQGNEEQKLQSLQGVEVRKAPSRNPRRVFTVCHQKFAVIDDGLVVLGSANWATTSIPKIVDPVGGPWIKGNREWFVALRSAAAAGFFTDLFNLDWEFEPPQEEAVEEVVPLTLTRGTALLSLRELAPPRRFQPSSVEVPAGVEFLPILSPQNYLEEVSALLRSAQRSICIQQQYIKGLGVQHVPDLLAILRDRKDELDIRIISSSAFRESLEDTINTLQAFGLADRLRLINLDVFKHCHNKGLVLDGEVALVTSTNWSENSIGAAREAGILIRDARLAGYFQEVFDSDWDSGWTVDEATEAVAALEAVAVEETELAADFGLDPSELF